MRNPISGAISTLAARPLVRSALTVVTALSAVLFADALLSAPPAAAQQGFGNFFSYQAPKPRRTAKKKRQVDPAATQRAEPGKAGEAKKAEKSGPTQPVSIIVSLGDQHASIYDANGFVTRTRVSSGQAGHRTPSGVFSIIGKSRWHRSNIYSGAPMPYMQRITWSGVALHAGVVPGYPASHGCIRLPAGFAPQLFGMTRMGARVVVSPSDVQPVEFSHPLLPTPKMQEVQVPQETATQTAQQASVELASADVSPDKTAATETKLLNPIAFASVLKKRAVAEKAAASAAEKAALQAAQTAGAEARQATTDLDKAEANLKAAEAKAADPAPVPSAKVQPASQAPTDTGATPSPEEVAAQAEVAQAKAALEQARATKAEKSAAAFAAVEAYKLAAARAEEAGNLIDEAERRSEQVSVLISRKEGRIFIRQAWKPVWEAPITIRDPERPIGTHIYSAVEPSADGSKMRWTAITMPAAKASTSSSRDRKKSKTAEASQAAVAPPETASGALDRIELPDDARQRISELLWTGGSLIVTDEPRSPEMSENATDFIVLTR
ncbi:L,D-transpeptidase [Hyphomicrobium sp. 1Nfss2.1]|uniref:L,D-transpeptidase n=1 Tax=Hyphomicrobium sp. 1Nfss2.1 TaxID=3413936 RepID=UPI003C7A5C43